MVLAKVTTKGERIVNLVMQMLGYKQLTVADLEEMEQEGLIEIEGTHTDIAELILTEPFEAEEVTK